MPKFKLHLDSNFCGVNEDIYFTAEKEPDSDEMEQYTQEWIGACWDIEEIEEGHEDFEDFEDFESCF